MAEMLLSNGQDLRHRRRGGVREVVQEFDAFLKVSDDVKEEPKAVNGILSVFCFLLIAILLIGELYYYWTNSEVEYRFSVDTDFQDNPMLDIDMIIAAPCNNLAIMPMGVDSLDETTHLKKSPTRYEMNPDEEELWSALKRVHREYFKPGTSLKALNEIKFVDDEIEEGLQEVEEEKERRERIEMEIKRVEAKAKRRGEGTAEEHVIMMIGSGFGVFQIIASGRTGGNDEIDEGSACRVHGQVPVLKGNGDRLSITVGKALPIGNIIQHIGSNQHGNISHRIERFHFGPHIWGLVTPLAGNEQFATKPGTTFKYFVKVVPTRIYKGGFLPSFGRNKYLSTYQYAVTYTKKEAQGEEHVHDSILFDYEFSATVIEVHPVSMSLLQLLLRICSLIGGIFATSAFLLLAMSLDSRKQFSYLPKVLNGGFAGIVGVTCVFPIDLCKTRLQTQRVGPDGSIQYKGILDCFRQTWHAGGSSPFQKIRSFYSGSGVNILLITPEKAIKLVANDVFRHSLEVPGQKNLSTLRGMLAGGSAGLCQIIVTTPMELLKIQLQQAGPTKMTATNLALSLFREKGIFGLYRGIGPTMARDVTFSVMYFPLFAALDGLGPRKSDGSGNSVFYSSFLAGLFSGAVSAFSCTPLDVIKTRIQLISSHSAPQYTGILNAFVKILQNEGPMALFKGAGCRMLVMAPLFGIAQMVYYIGVADFKQMELLFRHRLRQCLLLSRSRQKFLPALFGACSQRWSSSAYKREGREVLEELEEAKRPLGYDPELKLVASLRGSAGVNMDKQPPFKLDGMDKAAYFRLFDEQLGFEHSTFTPVLNLARRSTITTMEEMIEEWDWHDEIEQNLIEALEKAENWSVRACLKPSLVRECSRQLVKLTHAILCRGQHAIPMTDLYYILGRIVLLLNQPAFDESIAIDPPDNKEKLRTLFNLYLDYFLVDNIAQTYTIREWWYLCASRLGINPKIYPDIELFNVPKEITTLLMMVLLDSCSFKPPPKKKPRKEDTQPADKSKKKRARNWPHAFYIRELAISELSPHGVNGEKTSLCKMLCVHSQLHEYNTLHEFEYLHFPSAELPMKLPPRPWLDVGHCGPGYTFGQNVARKFEAFPDMDSSQMIDIRIADNLAQGRPVFDALNLLGTTPWIINKEMLSHMRHTLSMSYDYQHKEFLRSLAVPLHPSAFNIPSRPRDAWNLGVLTFDDFDGIIVDKQKSREQNRELVLELLKLSPFWTKGKWIKGKRGKTLARRKKEWRRMEQTEGENEPGSNIVIEKPRSLTDDQGTLIEWRYSVKVKAMFKERYEQNSLHCWMVYRLTLAQHFADSVLYFPHNIDFRGRAYPISPQINHMGDDLNRGLLKFAKGKPLGERGLEWLKLHCVNITGRKKREPLGERLKFADENLSLLASVANDPFAPKIAFWWHDSEEPWQTLAACIELRDALSCDRPEDFVSHLPIHQDGSCNGLQHYAAMGRDLLGAREVNLLPDDAPRDLYSNVAMRAEEMRLEHEQDKDSKWHKKAQELRTAMPSQIERKVIKQTIMTTVYGVTQYGAKDQIGKQLFAIGLDKKKVRNVFAPYLTHCVFASLTEAFTNSMALMEWFKCCAKQALKLGRPVEWRTPLGLPVVQPYVTVEKQGTGLIFRPVTTKQTSAFPPNFVHSLDSTHMMLTALHCYRRGITYAAVHDCFWTHASDVDEMNRICREQFIALHEQPITEQLSQFFKSTYLPAELRQLMAIQDEPLLKKMEEALKLNILLGDLDITKVRESQYFFS
uniref:DNA-directed RNA polymerase n=1 Tax=Globodera rostochiensis TaxID=31243 RepID=A0A914HXC6_GLORO